MIIGLVLLILLLVIPLGLGMAMGGCPDCPVPGPSGGMTLCLALAVISLFVLLVLERSLRDVILRSPPDLAFARSLARPPQSAS